MEKPHEPQREDFSLTEEDVIKAENLLHILRVRERRLTWALCAGISAGIVFVSPTGVAIVVALYVLPVTYWIAKKISTFLFRLVRKRNEYSILGKFQEFSDARTEFSLNLAEYEQPVSPARVEPGRN